MSRLRPKPGRTHRPNPKQTMPPFECRLGAPLFALCLSLGSAGCATGSEQAARAEFSRAPRAGTQTRPKNTTPGAVGQAKGTAPHEAAEGDGSLNAYTRVALEHSPELRAKFEEWHASTYRMAQVRRLPEPQISYTFFIQSVETRVGPQQHRIGVSQSFPWPTRLSSASDSASSMSRGAQQAYEAKALDVMRQVADSYWRLWLLERMRRVEREQQSLLEQLAASVRARVEVGQAGFADLGQINLALARRVDALSGLDERQRKLEAALIRTLGGDSAKIVRPLPIDASPPRILEPVESDAALARAAELHPRVLAMSQMAQAQLQQAESVNADRYPSFTVGMDYIVTGEARMAGVPDSGKDAVSATVGVKLPIWGSAYSAAEDEARARGAAYSAEQTARRNDLVAEVDQALSDVRDSIRRVRLYESTLVVEAGAVFEAVVGGYQAGTSTVSALLSAQRDLLELQVGLFQAQADHGLAWARLEAAVGGPVAGKPAS